MIENEMRILGQFQRNDGATRRHLYDRSIRMSFSGINRNLEAVPFLSRIHLFFAYKGSMNMVDHDYSCIEIDEGCSLINSEEGAFGFLSDDSACFTGDIHG